MNENDEVSTEEVSAEQAQADFNSGFTGQDVETEPAKTEATEATETTENAEAAVPPTVLAGLTEDQVRNLLAKASEVDALKADLVNTRDTMFGRYGDINRKIGELGSKLAAPAPVAGAPRFTAESFKKLRAEYGDEMAKAIAEDMNSAIGEAQQQGEPPDISAMIAPHIAALRSQIKQEAAIDRMSEIRPDWTQEIISDEFKLFQSLLPPERRAEWESTWDHKVVSGVMSDFDKWKQGAQKAVETKSRKVENNRNRLEAAIQPKSTTPDHTLADDEAFNEGFKSVRGHRL